MDLKYRRVRMVGGIPRSLHHALVALGTARFGGRSTSRVIAKPLLQAAAALGLAPLAVIEQAVHSTMLLPDCKRSGSRSTQWSQFRFVLTGGRHVRRSNGDGPRRSFKRREIQYQPLAIFSWLWIGIFLVR